MKMIEESSTFVPRRSFGIITSFLQLCKDCRSSCKKRFSKEDLAKFEEMVKIITTELMPELDTRKFTKTGFENHVSIGEVEE